MKLKKIQKKINEMEFLSAYKELCENNYVFNFKNLSRDFPKVTVKTMYMFLMFAISIDETVEKHLAICYYLYFMKLYISGSDLLIKWHLLQVLKISPDNQDVLKNWIFGVYNGNPDCPFSNSELVDYKKRLLDT